MSSNQTLDDWERIDRSSPEVAHSTKHVDARASATGLDERHEMGAGWDLLNVCFWVRSDISPLRQLKGILDVDAQIATVLSILA